MKAITLESTADKYIISIDKNSLDEETILHIIETTCAKQVVRKKNLDENINLLGKEEK